MNCLEPQFELVWKTDAENGVAVIDAIEILRGKCR